MYTNKNYIKTNVRFKREKALTIGGSRGIGAAIAKTLAPDGAAVAFTYEKSKDQADAVVSEIKPLGCIAVAILADSADIGAIAIPACLRPLP
ncbi:SDR family NAD(P)-dependent oxidoreductase [Dyadobacter beijingensis]|uniref:SDR family NAD(P)-dependent oxidoreductase n=1 Tax=Dyadobacter beijingensis TaxID=365489 RepID=UPI000372AE51|nr:SDR family NAD(P)-dependent oxidoreductase [Dyadobacter beijingensis]